MTHICVSDLTTIGSDNGLSPGWRQAIIWTGAGILLIGPLRTNFSEISIAIHAFSFKKIHVKMSSAKWRLFRLGLNVLILTMIVQWNHNLLMSRMLSCHGTCKIVVWFLCHAKANHISLYKIWIMISHTICEIISLFIGHQIYHTATESRNQTPRYISHALLSLFLWQWKY